MPKRELGLTFSGGGNRSFYMLGLLDVWAERLLPRVGAVATCSAGACVIAIHLSGRAEQAMSFWKRRREGVTKNFYWERLLKGQSPAPHGPIYRDTMIHTFRDGGLERIQNQPFPIYVLCARSPRFLPASLMAAVGITVYNIEKRLKPKMIHPSFGRRIGFEVFAFDLRQCASPEDATGLILSSSATPPFTPLGTFAGNRLLDGGLIDNAPAFLAEQDSNQTKNLVLLTRPYPQGVTGRKGHRLYIAPSKPVPADRWDYTRPHLVEDTIQMGRDETALHQSLLEPFLSD